MAESDTDTDRRNEAEPLVRVMVENGLWEDASFSDAELSRLPAEFKDLLGTYTVVRSVSQTRDMKNSGPEDREVQPAEKITYHLYSKNPFAHRLSIKEQYDDVVVYETHLTGEILGNENGGFRFDHPNLGDRAPAKKERRRVGTNGRITDNLVNNYLQPVLTFERVTPSPLNPDNPIATVQVAQQPKVAG